MGKEIIVWTSSVDRSLGQQRDRKLLVTKNACKSYCWVVCAWSLPFYHGMWSAGVCANATPVFPWKKSVIRVVFSYDLVQWIYAGHDQKAEVISHSESVSQDLSSFF